MNRRCGRRTAPFGPLFLSVPGVTIGVMADTWGEITGELPQWVAPEFEAVRECYRVGCRLTDSGFADEMEKGTVDALHWLVIGEVSPMTERSGAAVSREAARAESWVALCAAAGMPGPTDRDWQRLQVEPRAALPVDAQYAYGVWRALAWLLGVREDWPVHTGWHRAAGIPSERAHIAVPPSQRGTPAWREADRAYREQALADACRHWRHVRRLADATADPAPGRG